MFKWFRDICSDPLAGAFDKGKPETLELIGPNGRLYVFQPILSEKASGVAVSAMDRPDGARHIVVTVPAK